MKLMPNINIPEYNLNLILGNEKFDYGGEAAICRSDNPHTLYKIFTNPTLSYATGMFDNKYKKILKLYENPVDNIVQPISTLSCQGQLIGYEMTYDKDDEALFNMLNVTRQDRLEYLRKSSEILKYFASKDITYGDIKDDNILINKKTGEIKFCDIDNMQVGNLPIDILGHGLYEYYNAVKCIDEKTDAYMHNLFFLEQLRYNDLSYKTILTRLAAHPIMPEFPEEAQEIIKTLTTPTDFKGEYIIEYIKRR